jgi:methionyl-tRNA formyltransferase
MNKLVFFGSGEYLLPVLKKLREQFEISLIITTENEKDEPIVRFANNENIEYVSVSSFNEDLKSKIPGLDPSLAVVASFGLILPKEILDLFEKGILNIHPSLLPKYRGATPVQTAILNGDKTTGVSIIKVDEQMDHGAIAWQKEESILSNDTAEDLYKKLFKIASESINELVKKALENKLQTIPQDNSKAIFVKTLNRESGCFNLDNPPSKETLSRMIRAFYPWPGVWTKAKTTEKELRIKFLPDQKLQVEGKKPINLKDFKNGYPMLYNKIEVLF